MNKNDKEPVLLMWASGKTFLESVKLRNETATFALNEEQQRALPPTLTDDTVLLLRLRFGDNDRDFHIHAQSTQVFSSDPPGAKRLEFLTEEKGRQELVLASAEGESIPYRRRYSARITCDLPVRARSYDGRSFEVRAANISGAGIYLVGDIKVDVDAPISLWVSFSETEKSFAVSGRVASVIGEGPQRGAGIEFRFQSSRQREELVGYVEEIAQKIS